MPLFTCIACRVAFVDANTQRAHYKTDWHRYNLKRKVAELPPVTADNFKQRVLNAQQSQVPEEKLSSTCKLCGKHFRSANSYQNHIQSKKHKEAEAKLAQKTENEVQKLNEKNAEKDGEVLPGNEKQTQKDLANMQLKEQVEAGAKGQASSPEGAEGEGEGDEEDMEEDDSDTESVESWDDDTLGIEECLFCSFISKSLEENVKHMTIKHSFFIPDLEYLVDMEGLITYLGQKIGCGKMCLWCNEKGKRFRSSKAAQQHMLDKGHCKMLHEGDTLLEYTDFYDYRSSYPDYEEGAAEGGDMAEAMEEDEEQDGSVGAEPDVLAADGYELMLPSGAVIGHRSLMKYYKQSLPEKSADRTKSMVPRMLAQYKALGWTGNSGKVAQQRFRDLGAVQRMKTKHFMQKGVKANKFQPHFRPQVVF